MITETLAAAFPDAPESLLRALALRAEMIRVRRGEAVYRQGEAPEQSVILVSGSLAITAAGSEDALLRTVAPGDTVAFAQAIDGSLMPADTRATKASVLVVIPASVVRELAQRHPALVFAAIRDAYRETARMGAHIANARVCDAAERIIDRLRFDPQFARASQHDRARALGLRRETVSRVITTLLEQKVLEQKGPSLVVAADHQQS